MRKIFYLFVQEKLIIHVLENRSYPGWNPFTEEFDMRRYKRTCNGALQATLPIDRTEYLFNHFKFPPYGLSVNPASLFSGPLRLDFL